jgi:hypothetical protein
MTVETLTELFEEELTQAVEVKDPKSLHRYVSLLADRLVQRQDQEPFNRAAESRFDKTLAEIQAMRAEFEKDFAVMNVRFEASDKRWDDMMGTNNQRFEDLNKRIGSAQWLITFVATFGFTLMGAMMTIYHFVR